MFTKSKFKNNVCPGAPIFNRQIEVPVKNPVCARQAEHPDAPLKPHVAKNDPMILSHRISPV